MKVLVDKHNLVGTLLGTPFCMLLENDGQDNYIQPVPIQLTPGEVVSPGAKFTKIGSKETSGGNQPVFMNDGSWFEYQGLIRSLQGYLAVFKQFPKDISDEHLICYWYHELDEEEYSCFHYFTQSNAGRSLKLTDCEYDG